MNLAKHFNTPSYQGSKAHMSPCGQGFQRHDALAMLAVQNQAGHIWLIPMVNVLMQKQTVTFSFANFANFHFVYYSCSGLMP